MTRFRIIPEQSEVLIEASSSVHPIRTRTTGLQGFVEFDLETGPHIDLATDPRGELILEVRLLSSGNPLEDREMRRRIDARRFPTIEGRITEMRTTGEGGRYRVRGDLTFRGVTRSCEDEITFTAVNGGDLKIHGQSTFDVRDFGMEPPRILMLRVHPEVKVTIEAVAAREEG